MANQVARVDDFGVFRLEAGRDYFVAAQPFFTNGRGRWLYTLAQPIDFFLSALMAGSWFNPDFPGQGFFLDVFPDLGQLFLAWFTYDLQAPNDPGEATVGYAGSRWLTAFGPFSGAAADLSIELTEDGRFHDPAPVTQDTAYGTLSIEFEDCDNGEIIYSIPSAAVSGTMPITRIVKDNVQQCQEQTDHPGTILTD